MDPHEVPPCGPGMFTTSPSNGELYLHGYIEVPKCGLDGCAPGAQGPVGFEPGYGQVTPYGPEGTLPMQPGMPGPDSVTPNAGPAATDLLVPPVDEGVNIPPWLGRTQCGDRRAAVVQSATTPHPTSGTMRPAPTTCRQGRSGQWDTTSMSRRVMEFVVVEFGCVRGHLESLQRPSTTCRRRQTALGSDQFCRPDQLSGYFQD